MAGGWRGIAVGNVLPRCSRTQHPENPVQHLARVPPWATAAVGAGVGLRNQRFEDVPLRILEIHGSLLDAIHDAVGEQLTRSQGL